MNSLMYILLTTKMKEILRAEPASRQHYTTWWITSINLAQKETGGQESSEKD